jgi:5-formaminoimidazole-4-carboxamide-1-(beta)-D-ribofuranosyl 5'-monophosphate synthetase
MTASSLLEGYDRANIAIATLGGHSALDICAGAKRQGLRTIVIAEKGREKTYSEYYKTHGKEGCVDDVLIVEHFADILTEEFQNTLSSKSALFVPHRYVGVYVDPVKFANTFHVPVLGSRWLLAHEDRRAQTALLTAAAIRTPRIFAKAADIDRLCIVKATEATRGYERGFFLVRSEAEWEEVGSRLEKEGKIAKNWREAPIEEFILGAPVNFHFFLSPLTGRIELLGTDMRRQTNLDGILRLPARDQSAVVDAMGVSMIETGHIACTVKESLLEKAFMLAEKFVAATEKADTLGRGIIGPFALQGAVIAEQGKEDIVIFDVSLRMPGSPGIAATPYTSYLHDRTMSTGERLALEVRRAIEQGKLEEVVQ